MITTEQARTEYGFMDGSDHEDQLALGLYQAALGLFPSPFMRTIDYLSPLLVYLLQFAILLGMILTGMNTTLLLLLICMGFVFVPRFMKTWRIRSMNSGMLHIESEQGTHFLVARGTCAAKREVKRNALLGRGADYVLKVHMNNGKVLDDVIIMKELYDEMEKHSHLCLMMADSPNAKQIIAAPLNFADTVLDKKRLGSRQFEHAKPELTRTLSVLERGQYVRQYEDRVRYWKQNYLKLYTGAIVLGAVGGTAGVLLKQQSMAVLFWFTVVCFVGALIAQMQEFNRKTKFLKEAETLTAVDVTVHREKGWTPDRGSAKKPDSCVDFIAPDGSVLWSRRTAEDLKIFRHGEQAVLIIDGSEMIPLHRSGVVYGAK